MRAVCGQQAAEWDKNRKITQCGITEQNRSSSSKVLYYAKTLALTTLHRVTAWLIDLVRLAAALMALIYLGRVNRAVRAGQPSGSISKQY